jgi:hypothetical protein
MAGADLPRAVSLGRGEGHALCRLDEAGAFPLLSGHRSRPA